MVDALALSRCDAAQKLCRENVTFAGERMQMASPQLGSVAPRVISPSAEIVAWQSSRRIGLALVVGFLAATLRAFDAAPSWVWPLIIAVSAYVGLVWLVTTLVRRKGDVTTGAIALLAVADVTIIFSIIGLVVPASYFVGGLLLRLVALQVTQVYFGRRPAIVVVITSVLAYIAILANGSMTGTSIPWAREAWVLALYLLVAGNAILLHVSANDRLATLVDLFRAAQHGDFTRAFVEQPGREPDGITMLGRAYNHLRIELAGLVMTDPVSGCLNSRGLDQVLHRAVAAAARAGDGDIALLAIDIDRFKEINDTLGHLAGDAVLRDLASVLTNSSRAGDVVARIGGDEFVVLLPGADGETAGVVAERVVEAVRTHVFHTERGTQPVAVSIGVAAEQTPGPSGAAALRARADEALYVAKRLGRNRVVMWAPGIRSHATPSAWIPVVTAG
jgi:diguanylate cyclase (GGDEF)-like protein